MKLYVPTNGDKLRLTSDWSFTLINERYKKRNESLFERLNVMKSEKHYEYEEGSYWDYPPQVQAQLPAGTILQVDRVYIRKFNSAAASVEDDYDSITFQVITHPIWKDPKRKVLARFWVKLCDANTIEFEHAAPPRWADLGAST